MVADGERLASYLDEEIPGMRVVALEDQPVMRKILAKAFAELGFVSLVTDSWGEASQAISLRPPRAFVLDLNMPALPGELVAPILRRHLPRESPIVLFSGLGQERLRQAMEAIGTTQAFAKRDLPQLLAYLRSLPQGSGLGPSREQVQERA